MLPTAMIPAKTKLKHLGSILSGGLDRLILGHGVVLPKPIVARRSMWRICN
jgi:hypothetical protein